MCYLADPRLTHRDWILYRKSIIPIALQLPALMISESQMPNSGCTRNECVSIETDLVKILPWKLFLSSKTAFQCILPFSFFFSLFLFVKSICVWMHYWHAIQLENQDPRANKLIFIIIAWNIPFLILKF